MITIRRAQLEALSSHRSTEFERLLTEILAVESSERGAPLADALIPRLIADAHAFGLLTENEIARFGIITSSRFGCDPGYKLPRAALAILTIHGMPPTEKLERYQSWAAEHKPEHAHAAVF